MKNILDVISKTYYTNTYSTDVFFTVQDVCGPLYTWPNFIKKIIISKSFKYPERLKLLAFFWVNGYQNEVGWLQFIIKAKGLHFRRYEKEIYNMHKYFQNDLVQNRYFSYCMMHQQYEYLNGSRRNVRVD